MLRRPKLKLVNACNGDALSFGSYSCVINEESYLEWYARVVTEATGVPRDYVKFIVPISGSDTEDLIVPCDRPGVRTNLLEIFNREVHEDGQPLVIKFSRQFPSNFATCRGVCVCGFGGCCRLCMVPSCSICDLCGNNGCCRCGNCGHDCCEQVAKRRRLSHLCGYQGCVPYWGVDSSSDEESTSTPKQRLQADRSGASAVQPGAFTSTSLQS